MINQIIKFHADLEKGECVKIIEAFGGRTYVNRTDLIKKANDNVLLILRANGSKVAVNVNYIVVCCVIRRL